TIKLSPRPSRLAPRLAGYPSFAHFIARDADAAIYRKYQSLSARSLLYLQSELHELERQLDELDASDVNDKESNGKESQKLARLWQYYAESDSERARKHRDLQTQISVKLKEYHDALIRESQVLKLSAPAPRTLKVFKTWFLRDHVPVLWGRDQYLFRDEDDLVALAPVETDRLNIFLQTWFGWFLKAREERL
ncbi:MAG: hypothetical protein Q9196_007044, partial [Gyalolechia fulgens]